MMSFQRLRIFFECCCGRIFCEEGWPAEITGACDCGARNCEQLGDAEDLDY